MMDAVTIDDLSTAIMNSVTREGDFFDEEAALDLAYRVLNFFGYADRIIDNVLEPEDRDAFYMLEDRGILSTAREETTLYDGREWRIHYWLFRKDIIESLINTKKPVEEVEEEEDNTYADLPDDIWARSSS